MKQELERKYLEEKNSIVWLAKHYNTSAYKIRRLLKSLQIPLKSHKTASREANSKTKPIRKGKEFAHQKLSDKNWLYQKRIEEKLSKENIAKEIGCSPTLVNKYLKKHKIPSVKYNESPAAIKALLENKDFLTSLYSSKNMEQIAKEIGTTKSTISVAFQKLGINPKPSNSYNRKIVRLSKEQQSVIDYIRTIYDGEILVNNRSIVGTEIDILIPEKNFGIEYNGLFYHSVKDKQYHLDKTKKCAEKGIFLFHIFSDQWRNKQDIVKSMISARLGLVKTKYYARKLEIREVGSAERKQFFDINHIQGADKSKFAYGLYDSNSLICVMSFASPRYTKKHKWELIRFATCLNTICIGGFSRLLKHSQNLHPGSIVSYSDRSYSDGKVYLKNGFFLDHINPPGYSYVGGDYKMRYLRTMFTKKQLKRKFRYTKDELSESQIMTILGFKRIYDCGTLRWIKN